jgi:hypothetical protein
VQSIPFHPCQWAIHKTKTSQSDFFFQVIQIQIIHCTKVAVACCCFLLMVNLSIMLFCQCNFITNQLLPLTYFLTHHTTDITTSQNNPPCLGWYMCFVCIAYLTGWFELKGFLTWVSSSSSSSPVGAVGSLQLHCKQLLALFFILHYSCYPCKISLERQCADWIKTMFICFNVKVVS